MTLTSNMPDGPAKAARHPLTRRTPPTPTRLPLTRASKPRPLSSITSSARRLTGTDTRAKVRRAGSSSNEWQKDAWDIYDMVGEQRYLAATLANRLGQARFYVGEVDDNASTDAPQKTEDDLPNTVLGAFGGTSSARTQLIVRMAINLFVAGEGWLAGIPQRLLPENMRTPDTPTTTTASNGPQITLGDSAPPKATDPIAPTPPTVSVDDLYWAMLSVSEVTTNEADGTVTITLPDGQGSTVECDPDGIFLIRVWRAHPRYAGQADSPTRSCLPVLRELVGLTMHIGAQIDSRLAGAGLLIVPQSAQDALKAAIDPGDGEDSAADDQFTEALMEAMLTPINDRESASAIVPLVVTAPDDATSKFEFMNFSKPLDAEARGMRDEAIRRLALGQDAPPEVLLGTGGMNHWGAWLVQEDVVTTHLEPPLALICDALTTQYLWPVLMQQGYTAEQARKYVVWYDVSHLVIRPNHSQDAMTLHERGIVSDEAARHATGFDEADAPEIPEALPPEIVLALEAVKSQPSLMTNPGLPQVVAQIRATLNNEIPPVQDPMLIKDETTTATRAQAKADLPKPPEPGADTPTAIPATNNDPAVPPATGG